ncbi:uncharacterized protein LOC114313036 [Camellia sinensis]|uniref:uncharacterized protein LOC114313036 n=1 Tax=Camellia sinensis TaxID=4442 RepID=UPI0010367EF5|nr:uncharacterized protein LOC114313036 [Camellia sinensis]
MKTLEDQAEVAIKAKDEAEEKVGAAEAINKVLQAQLKEAEDKVAQAQKELQDALATKETEIKDADEKAYAQGIDDVTEAYEKQVKQACNKDEEGDEVLKDAAPKRVSANVPLADKSIDETLQEIDAELAAEKAAKVVSQQSSEVPTQLIADVE